MWAVIGWASVSVACLVIAGILLLRTMRNNEERKNHEFIRRMMRAHDPDNTWTRQQDDDQR